MSEHRFAFGQKLVCDGDRDHLMVVTGVAYYPEGAVEFQCSYWINGDFKSLWLPAWRLSEAPR